ncbi:MAG: presenilin family intramembrane aspartyl protease PSH [Ferroplasma sp.]
MKRNSKRFNSELLGIALFILSSAVSLYLGNSLYGIPGIAAESSQISIVFVLYYIIFIVIFTAITIYVVKKHAKVMKAFFLILVIYMIFFVSTVISSIIATTLVEYYAIIIIMTGGFAYLLLFRDEWYVTDAAGFVMISGAAAILGTILKTYIALALLIVFAIYDYISVYRTKHMVTLAKAAVDNNFPLMFMLPSRGNLKIDNLTFDNRGTQDVMMLGFGDMAIPEIFIVSASLYNMPHFLIFAIMTTAGALAALIFLFSFNRGKPAPGLPYINSGVIIGFLIALLIVRF